MTSYSAEITLGNVTDGEQELTFYPRPQRPEGNPGVLYLHGSGATYAAWAEAVHWASSELAANISHAGIPGVSIHMHGNQYANDVAMEDCLDAIPWLGEATGASATEAHVIGGSMGGGTALRFAALHPEKVASVNAIIPMVNINRIYTDNTLGLREAIGDAWGVEWPTPLPAEADLFTVCESIADNNIPVTLWYDEADPTILEADVLEMGEVTNATVIKIDPDDPLHTEFAMKWVNDHGEGRAQTIIDSLILNGA